MTTLQVKLGTRSYPIYIDSGLLTNSDLLSNHIRSKRICIVSNNIVAPLYAQQLKHSLRNFELDEIVLPDGEAEKSLANFEKIMLTARGGIFKTIRKFLQEISHFYANLFRLSNEHFLIKFVYGVNNNNQCLPCKQN